MSIKTWRAEFYPVPAREVVGAEAAIAHSLLKWEGLRHENLAKHGLSRGSGYSLSDGDDQYAFSVSSVSCALCALFLNDEPDEAGGECVTCPLYAVRGTPCCETSKDEEINPFDAFIEKGDPEPMIALIRSAVPTSPPQSEKP